MSNSSIIILAIISVAMIAYLILVERSEVKKTRRRAARYERLRAKGAISIPHINQENIK